VRAEVVDGEILAVLLKYGDQSLAHLKRPAFTFRNVADASDRREIVGWFSHWAIVVRRT
jgi:hypothetical protein